MSRTLKRPSSARRKIQQETFSPHVSSTRLRNVQDCLREKGADALLIILGIDGRYNEGTTELVNYLLFGFFDTRRAELESSGYEEEVIDDMMFLIRESSVDIYCNHINYFYLLPYVAHWRNLHFHCLRDEKYDQEKAEDYKIKSFIGMVETSHCIGIPFFSCAQGGGTFDPMMLERWPIVQAFALEGFEGGGFFTMKHKVVDVSEKLHEIYQLIDPVVLEMLVSDQLPQFEQQWSALYALIDVHRRHDTMEQLTEGAVSEPLRTYFIHGRVGLATKSVPCSRQPVVLFGASTSRTVLQSALKPRVGTQCCVSYKDTEGALHMVCQAVSPRSPITCARTYFFMSGSLPHPVGKTLSQSEKYTNDAASVRLLMQVYEACVHAVLRAISVYTQTRSASKAQEEAVKELQGFCRQRDVPINPSHINNMKHVEFQLDAVDSLGRVVTMTEGERSLQVKVVSLTVYDIPSSHSKRSPGSVCFAESFLDSTMQVIHPGGREELSSECVIHTRHVPYFLSWPAGEVEHAAFVAVEDQLKTGPTNVLGQCLCSAECLGVVTLEGNAELISDGQLYLCEYGLAYIHPRHGAIVLPKPELATIHVYDGESMDAVALLIVRHKDHLTEFLPRQLHSNNNTLVVAFQPRTKAYKALFKEVLPLWRRETEEPQVSSLSTLPEELQPLHSHLQDLTALSTALMPFGAAFNFRKAKVQLPDLSRFVDHFTASSVGKAAVPSRDLSYVLGQTEDQGSFDDDDQLIISVLGGMPGSHKESLAKCLMRLTRDESRWAVVQHPLEERQELSAEKLQGKLSAMWHAQHKHRRGTSTKKPRTLLVTPGFTDTADVIQAIVSHPDPEVSKHLKIGAVTVCVDESNTFMGEMYTLPNLLDQCAHGWVNNILLTGCEMSQEKEPVQELLRAVNCNVAFLVAEKGEVSRSTDIDMILSETAFSDTRLVCARYLSCPGWWQGKYPSSALVPPMDEVILSFSRPLDRKRLLNRLINLKQMHRKFPYTGNVYHLRACLKLSGENEDDGVHLYEVTHVVLSGQTSVTLSRRQQTPPGHTPAGQTDSCCAAFTGCQLEEEHLKNWLRQCTVQLPERKVERTRQSMTKTEINRIHKEHHLTPLPDGWFYNGHQFVNFDGEKSATHPDLEKFLLQYLDRVNEEVALHNARVDAMDHHDLFD